MFPVMSAGNPISGYNINNSLRFRASASAYLSRTPSSAGNRTTWTYSFWVKKTQMGFASPQQLFGAYSATNGSGLFWNNSNDTLYFYMDGVGNVIITSQVFRDPSAWYHIVLVWNTTSATSTISGGSTDRVRLYVNGTQVSSFSTTTVPAQNATGNYINNTNTHEIGRNVGSQNYLDGYLAEINFIDGQALTPSSFGQTSTTTGVWQPKAYTGTYGTNGFYLKFSDIATTSGSNAGLGKDFSGNSNYWTTNNISVTSGTTYDAMIDSPTNASASGTQPVGNYAVWNPVDKDSATVIVDGNLKATGQNSGGCATFGLTSGKWYWEVTLIDPYNGPQPYWGTQGVTPGKSGNYDSVAVGAAGVFPTTVSSLGGTYANGTRITAQTTWANGDVIGFAFDATNLTLDVYRNNSKIGTTLTVPSGAIFPTFNLSGTSGDTSTITTNFGQQPFTYTPPTGYKSLCTTNLPDSTIVQGNKYMDATLYNGTGATQSITNAAGFKPDWVWIKRRSSTGNHALVDSVRGPSLQLSTSDVTVSEVTAATGVTSFNSNGWSLGSGSTGYATNDSGFTYVGWQWQAGQGTTSSGTGTGGITSVTQSVNTTAGFSIVTYTGSGANGTVTHGLGVAPKMVIVKGRSVAQDWTTWFTGLSGTEFLYLNSTMAKSSSASVWNSTVPSSTVFSLGSSANTNQSSGTYVAYCFAEIAGFSKFGSYTGNGSTDGPFVYTGFRPKFIMIKSTATANSWHMTDTSRSTYNQAVETVWANENTAESTSSTQAIDILSNGFKIRNSTSEVNNSGTSLIYMAFAENPFKNALAR